MSKMTRLSEKTARAVESLSKSLGLSQQAVVEKAVEKFVREQFLLRANQEYLSFTEQERDLLQQEIAEWDVTLLDGIDHD